MEEAYEACRTILNDSRDKLEAIAQALIDKETLTSDELDQIFDPWAFLTRKDQIFKRLETVEFE